MDLIIDRTVWDRGNPQGGKLLGRDSDGHRKQCCVGIYLTACGLPDIDIDDCGSVSDLENDAMDHAPKWLWEITEAHADDDYDTEYRCNTKAANGLYEINDDATAADAPRERIIAEAFAKHGVNVTFVGEQS